MTYEIGQIVPFVSRRGIWRADIAPQWFAFRTPPQGELIAEDWFRRIGALDVWYPTEKRWEERYGTKRKKIMRLVPVAPQWILVLLDKEPHWDVLLERANGKIIRVQGCDMPALRIKESDLALMKQMPDRVREILEAIAEAKRIRPGDTATLDPGSALAWTVEVTAVHGEMATLIIPLLGGHETTVPVARLERMMG